VKITHFSKKKREKHVFFTKREKQVRGLILDKFFYPKTPFFGG